MNGEKQPGEGALDLAIPTLVAWGEGRGEWALSHREGEGRMGRQNHQ